MTEIYIDKDATHMNDMSSPYVAVEENLETPLQRIRSRINDRIHSRVAHIIIIVLVVTDTLIVLTSLLLELEMAHRKSEVCSLFLDNPNKTQPTHTGNNTTQAPKHGPVALHLKAQAPASPESSAELAEALESIQPFLETGEVVNHVLHFASLSILSLFMVEIVLKVFAMGADFFRRKLEIFDSLVIIVSFALDVALIDQSGVLTSTGLLIILRMWRVVRIVNAIVVSVHGEAENKIHKERHARQGAEEEAERLKSRVSELEDQIKGMGAVPCEPSVSLGTASATHNTEHAFPLASESVGFIDGELRLNSDPYP